MIDRMIVTKSAKIFLWRVVLWQNDCDVECKGILVWRVILWQNDCDRIIVTKSAKIFNLHKLFYWLKLIRNISFVKLYAHIEHKKWKKRTLFLFWETLANYQANITCRTKSLVRISIIAFLPRITSRKLHMTKVHDLHCFLFVNLSIVESQMTRKDIPA